MTMATRRTNRAETVAALCELAICLRAHPDTSLAVCRRELLRAGDDLVCEADLVNVLLARPELIDSWASFVEDQRTSDGWYVAVRQTAPRGAEWVLARPGRKDAIAFSSAAAAYAGLIARVVRLSLS
jgi:hypothetical protein